MIDVTHQITAVRRQVGPRTLESGEGRILTISQVYDTTIDDVWDACTNTERLPRWFAPVTGELRLGGKYQVEGNASGTIENCDPPKSFSATWEFAGAVSWIEVRLTPEAEGTRLELEHVAPVHEHWEKFGPASVGVGWDLSLVGLYLHLSSGGSADPKEAEAWTMSPEGVDFMSRSSTEWADADIAGGTDPEQARARAARTFAFFTTPPAEGDGAHS